MDFILSKNKIISMRDFIGKDVLKSLLASAIIGSLYFLVEFSFVFVLQAFLCGIGVLTRKQVYLPSWFPADLKTTLIFLVLFGFFRSFVYMLKNYYASKTQALFTSKQRIDLVAYSLTNASSVSTKEAVSAFTDTSNQAGFAIYHISIFLNTIISAVFFFFAGLRMAPAEMTAGISLLLIALLPFKILTKRVKKLGENLITEWENVSETLLRGLRNNFFLRVYNRIEPEIAAGTKYLMSHRSHYLKYSMISSIAISFPLMIGIWVLAGVTYISVEVIHTDPIKLVSFFYVFVRLAQISSESLGTYSSLKFNMPAVKNLYNWFNLKRNQIISNKNIEEISDAGSLNITVNNLSFSYLDNSTLFKNINFQLKKSEVLIIKGESGSGKSTLLSLLMGLNDRFEGEIIINGISVKEKKIDLQQVLGYVGPDPYLINGSIKDNLLYGVENSQKINDVDMWNALSVVEMDGIVKDLQNNLLEQIGDISFFSTGQKQRLSIARALVRKPTLLVLDEATANLDLITEQKIILNLQPMLKDCTTIIITHKPSFDSIATSSINL